MKFGVRLHFYATLILWPRQKCMLSELVMVPGFYRKVYYEKAGKPEWVYKHRAPSFLLWLREVRQPQADPVPGMPAGR